MRDRGARIQAEQRAKAKAFRIEKDFWHDPKKRQEEPDPKRVGKRAHTPKACSCHCCGNPRKFFKGKEKITMQERRQGKCQCEND